MPPTPKKTAVMVPTGASVDEFLAAIADPVRRADARRLCALMGEVTGEPAAMWGGGIVGFGAYHYRYASGREGDSALVSFAPRKQHLVLYLVGHFEDLGAVMARLGPHRTGGGCLYLRKLAGVDEDALRELIDWSVRVRRSGDHAF